MAELGFGGVPREVATASPEDGVADDLEGEEGWIPPEFGEGWATGEPGRVPFAAKKAIPAGVLRMEDEAWRERRRESKRRANKRRRRVRLMERLFTSSKFLLFRRVASVAALVIMVAAVGYMKLNGWGNQRAARLQHPEAETLEEVGRLGDPSRTSPAPEALPAPGEEEPAPDRPATMADGAR